MRRSSYLHFPVSAAALLLAAGTASAAINASTSPATSASCASAEYQYHGAYKSAGPAGFNTSNLCLMALSDGMAAVLLPAADADVDSVSNGDRLEGHKWGFIDQDGRLVIEPRFDEVRAFSHGLAAVRQDTLWGYVDRQGEWVQEPQWLAAGEYTEAGLAVVKDADGGLVVIGRDGAAVGDPVGRNVADLVLQDGSPALAIIAYKSEYLAADGRRRYVGGGRQVTSLLGDGPYFIATVNGQRVGVLDENWQWRLRPVYDEIDAETVGGLASVREGASMRLLDIQTLELGETRYRDLSRLADTFWLALPDTAGMDEYQILDASGKVVVDKLSQRALYEIQVVGNVLLQQGESGSKLYLPGQAEPQVLPQGAYSQGSVEGYLPFWRESDNALVGVVTPAGRWVVVDAASPQASSTQGEVVAGRLWLRSDSQGFRNVLDAQGRWLLDAAALQAVEDMAIRPYPVAIEGAPLAILLQGHCHCEEVGAGLLLADGSVVRDPAWETVRALQDEQELERIEQLGQVRFAAEREDGMVMLDARGQPIDMPVQQHIAEFKHGYALVFLQGEASLTDADGRVVGLPDYFDFRVVGPGLVAYVENAADDTPWGLYDVEAGRVVAAPGFREIRPFEGERAAARGADGRWGVLDKQGAWVLPAEYLSVRPASAGNGLWLVRRKEDGGEEYAQPTAVADAQGHILTPFVRYLDVRDVGNGFLTASTYSNAWLISPDGEVRDIGAATLNLIGDWLAIRRDLASGLLAGSGAWVVPPSSQTLTPLRGQPARALRQGLEHDELLDANGRVVARLAERGWLWPQESSRPLLTRMDDEGNPQTRFAGPDGSTVAQVPGIAQALDGDRVLVSEDDRAFRWLDLAGKPVGASQGMLGPLRDGLAAAQVVTGEGFGYVDTQGHYRIPQAYDAITTFQQGRAVVSAKQASFLIDNSGRTLASVTTDCGLRVLRGADGALLWPERLPLYCR